MSKITEDYSYSGLVSLLQGDKELGKKILVELAKEIEENKVILANIEKQRSQILSKQVVLTGGLVNTMRHLELNFPLTVVAVDEIFTIEHAGKVKFEKNIL